MYFTVYRTVNKLDGRVYIGKHQTNNLDDTYLGSGKYLNRAIEKYGRDNFTKEILFVFKTEAEMNSKEEELVTEEFCKEDTNYNLCPGGQGGWGYINSDVEFRRNKNRKGMYSSMNAFIEKNGCYPSQTEKNRKLQSVYTKKYHKDGKIKYDTFTGKKHTEETKSIISKKNSINQSGSKNSQFGSMWITNGMESKKINKSDIIPEGWNKGRKF